MQTIPCPSCGAPIKFQSSVTIYAVCGYCASMVVRHGQDVEAIGKMASLPEDMSPLQIGTEGKYKGVHFGLIGRARIGWADGSWNEWFMYVDDGRKGWLAEAQGFFAVSFEQEIASMVARSREVIMGTSEQLRKYGDTAQNISHDGIQPPLLPRIGQTLAVEQKILEVVDIKEAECIGSEGELPFTAAKGRKATYVDMIGEHKEFGSIEYSADAPPRIYTGEYVDFDELQFTNMRELEGWNYARAKA